MSHVVLDAGADPVPVAAAQASDGWRVRSGFAAPAEPWDLEGERWIVAGRIRSEQDAADALMLAVRGARLVVAIDVAGAWTEAFRADLRRLGGPDRPPVPKLPLSREQRELFDLLAEGRSIADAAAQLFMSLRTANRRIAEARRALGVSTTSEAVVAYARMRG